MGCEQVQDIGNTRVPGHGLHMEFEVVALRAAGQALIAAVNETLLVMANTTVKTQLPHN